MPSIRALRTFITVTRLGSFAAAGQAVGLTAAAVGQQMRGLEEELRRPLFDRSGRAVVLNTAGRGLRGPVEDLLARYDALTQDTDGQTLGGRVVMGALVSALMGAFADALWALKREHPGLEVTLFAGQSRDFAERVSRGELDAAVVTQAPGALAANLMWTPLYREPMVLIVPRKPAFKLPREPLEVLASAPFLRFDRLTWTGKLVDEALARCGAAPVRDEMELNSVEAIIALVRQGLGVAIVPQLANLAWSRDRTLAVLPLPGAAVQRRVGLLERRQHSRERFTREIKRYFVQEDQAEP